MSNGEMMQLTGDALASDTFAPRSLPKRAYIHWRFPGQEIQIARATPFDEDEIRAAFEAMGAGDVELVLEVASGHSAVMYVKSGARRIDIRKAVIRTSKPEPRSQ